MIIKLYIHKTATYTDPVELNPTEINYFFGSNGSGKTALSKVIANCSAFADCQIKWKTNPVETLVYNRDFVKQSFSQSNAIKGIFTLGKDSKETQEFIETSKQQVDELQNKIEGLSSSLVAQNKKLDDKMAEIANKAWSVMRKYEKYFKPAYTGYIGSAQRFLEHCLDEMSNTDTLLAEDDIKSKCNRIFNTSVQSYEQIPTIDFANLQEKENADILSSKIVGKEDIEIGRLIKRLNNSDWVKEGVGYLAHTEDTCPFCQQEINSQLRNKIESIFDESYNERIQELQSFKDAYSDYIGSLIGSLNQIISREIEILNFEELKLKMGLIEQQYKNNLQQIEGKLKAPSTAISLNSLYNVLSDIHKILEGYKGEIKENNDTVKNLSAEKTKLKKEIWKFIVNELDFDLKACLDAKKAFDDAKKGIESSILHIKEQKRKLEDQIKVKEAEVTSISHTIHEINKILNLFGFTNFSLSESSKKGFYQIIRENGSEVKETLSEGEYTFITFLYFYQLLKGSIEESGLIRDKVIVIDDPISSLDSDVLFIVSNLIKEIILNVRNGVNGIKQVFVLTHNIYFYKEVTFKGSRGGKWREESYWIVRRLENKTRIISHTDNPIKTTYELLWRELDDFNNINKATIYNTLRRILEYYFNIIGGLDYEAAINNFEGEEQIIFKSLVSWVNDGSHFINDDLMIYVEPDSIEKYLKVFQAIFTKMGHGSHYSMMMRGRDLSPLKQSSTIKA